MGYPILIKSLAIALALALKHCYTDAHISKVSKVSNIGL
jgi:hypothetical protein